MLRNIAGAFVFQCRLIAAIDPTDRVEVVVEQAEARTIGWERLGAVVKGAAGTSYSDPVCDCAVDLSLVSVLLQRLDAKLAFVRPLGLLHERNILVALLHCTRQSGHLARGPLGKAKACPVSFVVLEEREKVEDIRNGLAA